MGDEWVKYQTTLQTLRRRRCSGYQRWRPWWCRWSPCSPWRAHKTAGSCMIYKIWKGTNSGAGWLPGPVAPWENRTGAVCSWRIPPTERTHAGEILEEFLKNSWTIPLEQWKSMRKEWQNITNWSSLHHPGGEKETEMSETRTKAWRWAWGEGWGVREKIFLTCLCFFTNLLYLHSAINCIKVPQIEPIFPIIVIGKWSSCLYLRPQAFSSYFLSLSCWGEEGRECLDGRMVASQVLLLIMGDLLKAVSLMWSII